MSADADAAAAAFLAATGGGGGGGNKKNKKKNKKKGGGGGDNAQAAEAAEGASAEQDTGAGAAASDAAAAPEAPADEAARLMAEMGIGGDDGGGGGGGDKKKKKKGKKKPAAKESSGAPKSAVAKLALERLAREKEEAALQAAEEERLKKEAEEAERQAQEEERKKQEAKERKKQAAAEKKARDRASGKAVTKAEKAREAKARAARERLIASGMIKVDEEGNIIPESKPGKDDWKKKKEEEKARKKREKEAAEAAAAKEAEENQKAEEEAAAAAAKKAEEEAAAAAAAKIKEAAPASWDDSGSDDDWDAAPVIKLKLGDEDDEEEVVEEEVYTKGTGPTIVNPNKKKQQSKKDRRKKGRAAQRVANMLGNKGDDSDESSEYSDSEDEDDGKGPKKMTAKEKMRDLARQKEEELEQAREEREERLRQAMAKRSKDDLRSPICCVMGHVDTGKTKLLDKIRRTNVQEGEAGGITQQIGATYFPMENLKKITSKLAEKLQMEFKVPGLLVIDTPGHESFANLRKRGSSTADIAILVVDLVHGLEPQTIESINMLRARNTQFIVALNKVDRLFGWKATEGAPIRQSLKQQDDNVLSEFNTRVKFVITQLMEQGLNSALYYENKDLRRDLSLVPTSAHTGEGIPDLILLLTQLTQRMMVERLMFSEIPEATVLDVKKVEGVGTTIDVLLINGKLKVGDTIVVASVNGPVTTQIRALLTPGEMREMRVKGEYVHHQELKAAVGIKVAAQNLEDAIAGTSMMVLGDDDNEDELREAVMEDVADVMENISTTGRGVCVQASTIGSLEALLEFLRVSNIPVAQVNIGPINKRDVARASIMLEHKKEYACILAFDVKVSRDAAEYAEEMGVKIFTADIIYHLFDQFTKYIEDTKEQRRAEIIHDAVFPCILRIVPSAVFMKKNPLVMGVDVVDGICRVGTPLVVPDKLVPDEDNPGQTKFLEIGRIESIEKDNVAVDIAKKGSTVCVKIQGKASQSYVAYGRHFDASNQLVSKLSRESIDLLKENFKDDLEKQDWMLVVKLKSTFNII